MSFFSTCSLDIDTTLPLVCVCSVLSFLCGVGIGANDLSANFAMVVGSGSLNMKQAIIYCSVFELLGAAFMGGHVSNTIRNGIVQPTLFNMNRELVVLGMTCATMAAALWLYLSTVFGLPVSITHTVIGSIMGFAIFASGGFQMVKARGLTVIVISWVAAPLVACLVTALIFYFMRRDIFKVKGRSFELAVRALPFCLGLSLLVDFFFIVIEKPPIMTQKLAAYVPLTAQYVLLLTGILLFVEGARRFAFPYVIASAKKANSFVWERPALRTEAEQEGEEEQARQTEEAMKNTSFFKPRPPSANPTPKSVPKHGRQRSPSRPPTPLGANLMPSTSLRLSSIDASDRHMRRQGKVRLAAVSPAPESVASASYRHFEQEMLESSSSHGGYGTLTPLPPAAAPPHGAGSSDDGNALFSSTFVAPVASPTSVCSDDAFGEEDWEMDHPMEPIRFGGLLIKPFNPRAEYLFTGLQVVAGSMSSFVHGAVAGANATATFVILYDAFSNHELGETDLGTGWSVLPAMLGIAIGMAGLGASLMKTVGVELVTVTPARGWCIQVGGTFVTMILTGLGIPVSLSQSQVGAAIGCGVLDAKWRGVSWRLVGKIIGGWVVTLVISALTTGLAMYLLGWYLCAPTIVSSTKAPVA